MGTFQMIFQLCKSTVMLLQTKYVWTINDRAVGRFQILDGHTLSKVQIITMKLVSIYTKNSKYWMGKCPCAHPVPTVLNETSKWGTAWIFISRDIRHTSSQFLGYPSLINKIGLFGTFEFYLLWFWYHLR